MCYILFVFNAVFMWHTFMPMIGGTGPMISSTPICRAYGLASVQDRVFIADEGEFNEVALADMLWYNGTRYDPETYWESSVEPVLEPYADDLFVVTRVDELWYVLQLKEHY